MKILLSSMMPDPLYVASRARSPEPFSQWAARSKRLPREVEDPEEMPSPPGVDPGLSRRSGIVDGEEPVLNRALPPEQLNQLVEKLVRKVAIVQHDGQTSLRLDLSTPVLPSLGLELHVEGGRVQARFSVSDLASRHLLQHAAVDLMQILAGKGIAATVKVELEGREPGRRGEQGPKGQKRPQDRVRYPGRSGSPRSGR